MKKHEIKDLNELFNNGENCDKKLFAEQRTNCLLVAGEHFKRVEQELSRGLRDSRISKDQRLRLVKNHIQKITKIYVNNILSMAPGVKVLPYNENELRDQKNAELRQAIWQDAEEKQNIEEKIDRWANAFVQIGETAAKIYWDPNKGKFLGYKQEVDNEGNPIFNDAMGKPTVDAQDMMTGQPHEPVKSSEPVFQGELCIDLIYGFNLIRDKGAETIKESPWLAVRTMMDKKEAEGLINKDDPEYDDKKAFIQSSTKSTFKVFDGSRSEYVEKDNQVLIKEMYIRPCYNFPEGYFYVFTDSGILNEGSLSGSVFPIIYEGFDEIPTTPRHRSVIKPLRAPQAEINRMASKRAEHQITMGDDKLIFASGSKLSKGEEWSGIRSMYASGPAPVVIEGRAGEQFSNSLQTEIAELYSLANLEYEMEEKQEGDPYAMLFKKLAQRKKYSLYVRKFERFLCNVAKTYLEMAKIYLPDDYVINAVGKREQINIQEFRSIEDQGFQVKLKPMSNDVESTMGRQLNINQILQYIGQDLPANVRGKIIRGMPFLNQDQMFNDLTINDENIDSDILALDRGEMRDAQVNDEHELYISRLTHRTKQNDFRLLDPKIQEMYQTKIQQHTDIAAEKVRQLKEMESEFIPAQGTLVKVDIYEETRPGKIERAVMPMDALQWLKQKLETQGITQQQLQMQSPENQVNIMQAGLQQAQQVPQNQEQNLVNGLPTDPNGVPMGTMVPPNQIAG